MVFSSCLLAFALRQRRAKIRTWNLNTYGIFNDLFQSKINVLHLSKFLRSISWEPSVMIGWASQMDARETLCCHVVLCNPKTCFRSQNQEDKKHSNFLIGLRNYNIIWCEILHSSSWPQKKAQKRREKTRETFFWSFLCFPHFSSSLCFLSFSAATSKNSFFFSRARDRKREIERGVWSVLWFVLFILV